MMGSGGMIVMDEDDCMVSVARFYLDFTVEESCGKCTPCRIGNKRLLELLNKITEGKGTEKDLDTLATLGQVIKDTALCGLGQTSPNPVLSTLDNFYDEYMEHVRDKTCRAKQCKSLLTYTISPERCIGCHLCAKTVRRMLSADWCVSHMSLLPINVSNAACVWHAANSMLFLSAKILFTMEENKLLSR